MPSDKEGEPITDGSGGSATSTTQLQAGGTQVTYTATDDADNTSEDVQLVVIDPRPIVVGWEEDCVIDNEITICLSTPREYNIGSTLAKPLVIDYRENTLNTVQEIINIDVISQVNGELGSGNIISVQLIEKTTNSPRFEINDVAVNLPASGATVDATNTLRVQLLGNDREFRAVQEGPTEINRQQFFGFGV